MSPIREEKAVELHASSGILAGILMEAASMMAIFGPLLASLLIAQTQADQPRTGEVVDGQGKPVADAEVVFYSPPVVYGKGDPVEVRTKTDTAGKFSLIVPPLKRVFMNGVNFLAYRPGLAITANASYRPPHRLVLEKPRSRMVKVEGPDGQPIAGARVALRLLHVFGKGNAEVPASLADSLATRTGPDGTATIDYMAARDQLAAVRVSADSIGTQDILLIARPGQGSEESVIAIKLKKTSRIAGRVVDPDARAVANHLVEVWSSGDGAWLSPNTVELTNGPLRTAADGSFQTPVNLMVGSTYRVAVREEGKEPILSDWMRTTEQDRTLPLMVLRSLRNVNGRVVDRQGKPVANIEVFQSGDGPERTTTRTDADGRFSLGGFRQGPVFLFARGEGFRFQGQLVKPTERTVTVELTRTIERPAREMKMLPDPIPLEEPRALARRLVEPLWETAAQEGEDSIKYTVLSSLASVDPARVLERLQSVKFKDEGWKNRIQRELVLALAGIDFEEATAVAESFADPATKSWALVQLADRFPADQRARKLALLDRALLQARIATDQADRLLQMGEVAERWWELGKVDTARALFAEGLQLANQFTDKTDFKRGRFACRLARVNLPAALAIVKDFEGDRIHGRIRYGIALRLVERAPAEAERLWKEAKGTRLVPMDPTLCWKMAAVDPARARRIIEELPERIEFHPELFLFLALGSKTLDESASRQAFQIGVQGIDRLLQERPERYRIDAGRFLPIVERIDPALVPEVFWLDVASRLPVGNPRSLAYSPSSTITRLAWYDRDVAAALLAPILARLDQSADDELAADFRAWSLFDPRAAVARLEKIPVDTKARRITMVARLVVAASLAQTHEERWRKIWGDWDIILGGTKRDF
jgi:hypothetical protein